MKHAGPPIMATSLRVASFNVHMWMTAAGDTNHDAVRDTILESKADVVCLQEVVHPAKVQGSHALVLEHLAEALATASRTAATGATEGASTAEPWGWAFAGGRRFGVAVLSRHPITAVRAVLLSHHDREWPRLAIIARIDVPERPTAAGCPTSDSSSASVRVVTTHLDHLREETRMQEVSVLREFLTGDTPLPNSQPTASTARQIVQSSPGGVHGDLGGKVVAGDAATLLGDHLLCGDFNSLCKHDYEGEEAAWEHMARRRSVARVEAPQVLLTAMLLDKHGYRDSATLRDERSGADAYTSTGRAEATCVHGTRVDYILASGDSVSFVPSSYRVVDLGASDHALVATDVRLAAESSRTTADSR